MLNVDDYAMLMNVKSPLKLVKVLRKNFFLNIEVMFSDLVHGQSQGGRSGWGFWGDMAHWQLALLGGQSVQLSLFKNENKSTKLICKKYVYPNICIQRSESEQMYRNNCSLLQLSQNNSILSNLSIGVYPKSTVLKQMCPLSCP